jgi:hypothetical protein
METIIGLTVMMMVPGYFVLQAKMLARYRGRWRLAAALPLGLMLPALAVSLASLAAGSNLWPLAAIFAAPVCCLALLIVGGTRWFREGEFV